MLLQIREELGARLFITQTVLQAGMEDCSIEPKNYGGKAREELAALAADLDDAVAELYLADKPIAGELLMQTISDACRQRQLTPVCFGSAKLGVGMEALLQSIIRYLPAAQGSDGAPLSGLVYKVDHDPVLGKGAHIRLFNGCIKSRDPVPLLNSDEPEKATQIRRFNGAKAKASTFCTPVKSLRFTASAASRQGILSANSRWTVFARSPFRCSPCRFCLSRSRT